MPSSFLRNADILTSKVNVEENHDKTFSLSSGDELKPNMGDAIQSESFLSERAKDELSSLQGSRYGI